MSVHREDTHTHVCHLLQMLRDIRIYTHTHVFYIFQGEQGSGGCGAERSREVNNELVLKTRREEVMSTVEL